MWQGLYQPPGHLAPTGAAQKAATPSWRFDPSRTREIQKSATTVTRAVGGTEIMAQPAQAPAKRQPVTVITTIANSLLVFRLQELRYGPEPQIGPHLAS